MMQRHDFDPIAFIFGVVFTGLGVLFMIDRLGALNHAQWLWPGLLVLLGLAVLVGARGRGGAHGGRPAFESGSRIDPAVEDDLLHAPMRTVESEQLVDTSTLFTVQPSRAPEESATARVEESAASDPEERPTEERPKIDGVADTEVLPRPEAKED